MSNSGFDKNGGDKDIGAILTSLLGDKFRDKAIKPIKFEGDMVLFTAFKTQKGFFCLVKCF